MDEGRRVDDWSTFDADTDRPQRTWRFSFTDSGGTRRNLDVRAASRDDAKEAAFREHFRGNTSMRDFDEVWEYFDDTGQKPKFCETALVGGLVSEIGAGGSASEIVATPYRLRDPATIPLRPWIFGRWLLRCVLALVFAPGGVGKTRLLAAIALCLATSRALLGKTVWDGPKRVWIWNLEDERDELDRDMAAAVLHYGITDADIADRLFVDTAMEGKGLCTARAEGGEFQILEPVMEALTDELRRRRIDVLIVDPFVSSHEVDENLNVLIDKIAKRWSRVAKDANCAIVLVHHTHKLPPGVKVTANSGRGASALKDAARIALVLNKMDESEGKKLQVEPSDRWRYFSVQDDKHNRAPADAADWFKLESVSLGNGGMDGGDSVGVVTSWEPPDAFDGVNVSHLASVQKLIAEGGWRKDSRAERWAGQAVAQVLGLDADDESDAAKIKKLLSTWIKNKALLVEDQKDEETRKRHPYIVVGEPAQV